MKQLLRESMFKIEKEHYCFETKNNFKNEVRIQKPLHLLRLCELSAIGNFR